MLSFSGWSFFPEFVLDSEKISNRSIIDEKRLSALGLDICQIFEIL